MPDNVDGFQAEVKNRYHILAEEEEAETIRRQIQSQELDR
jgi:hypothetical protein